MGKNRLHFFNMYLTTTVSVALVLFLIGIECVLVMGVHRVVKQIRENVAITIVLTENAKEQEITRLDTMLKVAPYCCGLEFVSAQQALEDHIESLGEDPTKYLGYNPLTASFSVNVCADYVQADTIRSIAKGLEAIKFVDRVLYPEDVIAAIDLNVNKYSLVILGIAAILLLVAVSLILNTIRLQVYSRRFLINTMKLVGAKSWSIKSPIVGCNLLIGFVASVIAMILLVGLLLYAKSNLGIVVVDMNWQNMLIVFAVLALCGLVIMFVSSLVATNRYIRMKTNDLYFV